MKKKRKEISLLHRFNRKFLPHPSQILMIQKVGILLVFLAGFVSRIHDSSSASEVQLSDSNFDSNKYILKSYFEKHDNFVESEFQDFISDELPSFSFKLLPDDLLASLRLSVPNRLLIGEGSHRNLHSDIRIHSQAELISQLPNHYCKVIIIERLPVGVFADPFELQHLLQRGVFADIAVFGDANLELPSVASNRTIVEIHMNVSFSGTENEVDVSIEVPLHARYAPVGESGYAKIEFGRPDVFMECNQEGNLNSRSHLFAPTLDQVASKTGAVEWKIPCGRKSHAGMVSIVTFTAAFLSALVIVVTSLLYSDTSL